MSGDVVIRVENLSKKYVIKHANGQRSGDGLRHVLQNAVTAPFRALRRFGKQKAKTYDFNSPLSTFSSSSEDFFALKDVSFEVRKGEVLGIIGRNGAGKSTLLKILSRITEPTNGRIGIKGRVASLLEVGTGFHPELTGRENIFLNGAVLGMSRAEIRRKFDEIVAFSGVEKFLDTPVKRYSSGMYVRLAFAVAAHLRSEILIVDEVLAVGDTEFQRKCLGKMGEVAESGCTVLFVSHNLATVSALCTKCMFLEHGVVRDVGFTSGVIAAYLRKAPSERRSVASYDRQPVGSGSHVIKAIVPISHEFQPRKIVEFSITVKQRSHDSPFFLCLHIKDQTEREIFVVASEYLKSGLLRPGDQELKLSINTPWLAPGTYSVDGTLYSAGIIDLYRDACQFEISPNVANDEYSATSAKNAGPILASFSLNIAVQQIGGDSASFTAK